MKVVGRLKHSTERKQLFLGYKKKDIINHVQIPVKTDVENGTVNSFIFSSNLSHFKPYSLDITDKLKELNTPRAVENQYFNGHQISVSDFNETLNFKLFKNPLFNYYYYKDNIRCLLSMTDKDFEFTYLVNDQDFSLKKISIIEMLERESFLQEKLLEDKKNGILSEKASIVEIGDNIAISDKRSILEFVNKPGLIRHLDQLNDSNNSEIIIDSLLASGLITEDVYFEAKQKQIAALNLIKETSLEENSNNFDDSIS